MVHFHGRLVLNMNTIGVGGIKMNPQGSCKSHGGCLDLSSRSANI